MTRSATLWSLLHQSVWFSSNFFEVNALALSAMLGFSFLLLVSSMIKIITTETLNIIQDKIEVCLFSSTLRNTDYRMISQNRAKDLLLERLVVRRVCMEDKVTCRNQFLQIRIVEAVLLRQ